MSHASGARCCALALTAALALHVPAKAQTTEVDLELVLAVDVSGSMDLREHTAQRDGYVDAFRHRDVIQAIREGLTGRIAVIYVEWAGSAFQEVAVPWTVIDGSESAERFAAALEAATIRDLPGTSISAALDFALRQFDLSGVAGISRAIDVSGDGPNNRGRPVLDARADVLAQGIVINGLPIVLGHAGGSLRTDLLDIYYEDCVIGGPGAFMIAVDDITRLAEAIRRKLVLEIAGAPARLVPAQWSGPEAPARRIDCLIGEKLRRSWDYYQP